jgi:hypothetical protein
LATRFFVNEGRDMRERYRDPRDAPGANQERNEFPMSRKKKYPKHALARMTADEHEELRRRARGTDLSLSRFLIESGLAPLRLPPAEAREERDRALFHQRRAGDLLARLTHALERGVAVPPAALDEALREHAAASSNLAAAYERGGS